MFTDFARLMFTDFGTNVMLSQPCTFQFSTVCNNNMPDTQIYIAVKFRNPEVMCGCTILKSVQFFSPHPHPTQDLK
jgi:hypothetical protein